MTEKDGGGHSSDVMPASTAAARALPTFDEVYEGHFDAVWRSLARLGVPAAHLDDAAQEVFLTVHRRLGDFEGRSSLKTWLTGITLKVASTWRRSAQRRGEAVPLDAAVAAAGGAPDEVTARREALAQLQRILAALPDEQREVFVLMELEQQSAPEVAEALGLNVNTTYSRLRLARSAFNEAVALLQEGRQ